MIVRENINFERGMDPKESMDIGLFKFNVEYTGDAEDIFDSDKEIAKTWRLNGKAPMVFEGSAGDEYVSMRIEFSDGDALQFELYREVGPNAPQGKDYATISIESLEIQELDVKDEYEKYSSDGTIIGAILRIYEFFINPVEESLNFERGMNPKSSMKIGIPTWETLQEGDLIYVPKRVGVKNDNIISELENIADLPAGAIIIVRELDNASTKEWTLRYIYFFNMKDYKENKNTKYIQDRFGYIIGTPKQFREKFKFLSRGMNESLDFERGQDPKDAMNIGEEALNKKIIEETIWELPLDIIDHNFNIIKVIRNYKGEPILMMKSKSDGDGDGKKFISMSPDYRSDYYQNPEESLAEVKFYVDGYSGSRAVEQVIAARRIRKNPISNESLDFERGIDPKQSMSIGLSKTIEEKIYRIFELDDKRKRKIGDTSVTSELSGYDPRRVLSIQYNGDEDFEKKPNPAYIKSLLSELDLLKYFNKMEYERGGGVNKFYYFPVKTEYQHLFRKKLYKNFLGEILENINFERGVDPKSTMNIGKRSMIETWLKEYDLYEDAIIDKNLIINIPGEINLIVDLKKKHIEELPSYIQFGKVYGGFDISGNNLRTLRGCPTHVLETDKLKGNFKCHSNQLTSLEFAPKRIDGNFIGYLNPGKFIRKDVIKVCKVKSGIIWVDESRKVNESMDFQRNEDPMENMDIGFHAQVKTWFKSYGIFDPEKESLYFEYRINKDGTIDVLDDLNLVGAHIDNFPYFIRFNKIYGSFYVANNIFTSLEGFPKEVDGDLSIYSDQPKAKKWKESEIRKKVKVKGTIWN